MPDTIPVKQESNEIIRLYKHIKKLAESNRTADEITFRWSNLDNTTMSDIKQVIANIATNHNSPSKTQDENVKKYLKELFRNNMNSSVTIDYKKLKSLSQEGQDYATILRQKLQYALDMNCGRIYTSMTMNMTL